LHFDAVAEDVIDIKPWTFDGAVTGNPPVAFSQNVSVFSCPAVPDPSVKLVIAAVRVIVLYRVAVEKVGVAEKVTVSELATS
jgi:hypothetical protein